MVTIITRQLSFEDIKQKRQSRFEMILDRLDKPKTAQEIADELFELGLTYTSYRGMVAPRLTELEKMGYVKQAGMKKDHKSGKMVTIYEKV